MYGKLSEIFYSDTEKIREFISINNPNKNCTTHIYEQKTPVEIRTRIINISDAIENNIKQYNNTPHIKYQITRIPEMNELYSSVTRGTGSEAGSDAVFETNHVDGPFGFIPKCYLYRCVFTIINNTKTQTIIKESVFEMKPLEYVVIDYNRDVHRITSANQSGNRFVIKLHYAMTPRWLPKLFVYLFVKMNVCYNVVARKLFLYTIKPKTPLQKITSSVIMGTTKLFSFFYGEKNKTLKIN